MTKVPYLRFDTGEFPAEQRLAIYRAAVPRYEVTLPQGDIATEFFVRSDSWMLGAAVLSATDIAPVCFARTSEAIASDGHDGVSAFVLLDGCYGGQMGGRPITVGPGQVVLFDLKQPFDLAATRTRSIMLHVARSAFAAKAPLAAAHGLVIDGAAGRVLAEHLILLSRRVALMEADDTEAAVAAALRMVSACASHAVLPQDDMSARDCQLLHRVDAYIDRNLDNTDLSVATLCRALGVSRSSLYRLFAPLSGIADHIRARRLEAIHVKLEEGESTTNARIAAAYGFESETSFSRSFRQRFGYTPRQVRNRDELLRGIPVAQGGETVKEFQTWVAALG